jgi:hypothetical protein
MFYPDLYPEPGARAEENIIIKNKTITIPCKITRARIILFLKVGENFLSFAMLMMPANKTIAVAMTAIKSNIGTKFRKVLIDHTFNLIVF